ncbi:Holliday junction resolvase [Balnearium lithotrophicum]|uniref:Holliday junction resolvase n=1 Tax=Balnearium lithotrophicum TaxID=223788 RepID=A0A521DZZ3_9BACT|nr:Holliday junction resolvase [Balnearium lithotrophicum]SMO77202.1 Holliday junction resolvase [Balnearium lithotrophicum]
MNTKAKGTRFEREVKKKFENAGFEVVRSAASLGKADLYVEGIGSIQCKVRKKLSLYNLFDGADVLVVKADRKEPLVVIPLQKFLEIVLEKQNV